MTPDEPTWTDVFLAALNGILANPNVFTTSQRQEAVETARYIANLATGEKRK